MSELFLQNCFLRTSGKPNEEVVGLRFKTGNWNSKYAISYSTILEETRPFAMDGPRGYAE